MDSPLIVNNFINGTHLPPNSGQYLQVTTPFTGEVCAKVALSGEKDIQLAIQAAQKGFTEWKSRTIKSRAAIILKLHQLIQVSVLVDELIQDIV